MYPNIIEQISADEIQNMDRILEPVQKLSVEKIIVGFICKAREELMELKEEMQYFEVRGSDHKCEFCETPIRKDPTINQTRPHLFKAYNALGNESIPVCSACFSWCMFLRFDSPLITRGKLPIVVDTREKIVNLIVQLANETGVVPTSAPETFLSQIPKDKIMPALRLLRHMPTPNERKQ